MNQSQENEKKACFRAILGNSGPKSAIMGTNRIPNEIRFNFVFKIALFPIIMQKIRTFPWPNLEKTAKNAILRLKKPIFGPKIRHYGPKRPKKNFPQKKNTVTF